MEDACDHALALAGWGTLWFVSDGEFPAHEKIISRFAYCPFCGAPLTRTKENEDERKPTTRRWNEHLEAIK